MNKLNDFRNLDYHFFDCDGVILDSNKVKSDSFYLVAKEFADHKKANELVEYHKLHGGISRIKKFQYFFSEMLGLDSFEGQFKRAMELYSQYSVEGLYKAKLTVGFEEFIQTLSKKSKKYVVTGGSETEVRQIFKDRKIDKYFEAIYGNPRDKYTIIEDTGIQTNNSNSIFYGDSRLDYEVSQNFSMNFLFLTQYTEFRDWKRFFEGKEVKIYQNFSKALDDL